MMRGVEMNNLFDGDNSLSQKHSDFEDVLASMKYGKKDYAYKYAQTSYDTNKMAVEDLQTLKDQRQKSISNLKFLK